MANESRPSETDWRRDLRHLVLALAAITLVSFLLSPYPRLIFDGITQPQAPKPTSQQTPVAARVLPPAATAIPAPSATRTPQPTPTVIPTPTPDLLAHCGAPIRLTTYAEREATRADLRARYGSQFREADFNGEIGDGHSVQQARLAAGVPPCDQ